MKGSITYVLFIFKVKYDVTQSCRNEECTYPFPKTLV